MYDPEMRKDCPMRGNLGNCSPVGGFCMDAVSDEICEAVHNAYAHGFNNAVRTLKEQEAIVLCKDCKYWLPMNRFNPDFHPGRGQCELNCWIRDFDWFCADGERRKKTDDDR